ncbi:MAG TPA: hypothetical protein VF763_13730 [Candidatus Limnocylindrales bacterium]
MTDAPGPVAPEPDAPAAAAPGEPGDPSQPSERSQPPSPEPTLPTYKGGELDPARGPGLGCFYVQLVALVVLLVLTPLSVQWDWPFLVSAGLLLVIILLLLLSGQTVIFLLRLVAAERGRRRPLAGRSRTVGDLEEGSSPEPAPAQEGAVGGGSSQPPEAGRPDTPADRGSMRE